MTEYVKIFALSVLAMGLAASAAFAQDNDPLVCARAADGAPIRIGDEVLDAHGERIGAISLTQCSQPAKAGKVKVALDMRRGGQIKVVDLDGAVATNATVHLAQTAEEIAPLAEMEGPLMAN